MNEPRVIVALATERPNEIVWDFIKMTAPEIFSAPVCVQFAYFGTEGPGHSRRPCVSTRWVEDADDWMSIVNHARGDCVCGCFLKTGDFLEHCLREARQAPVSALVIIGDDFHGDFDGALAIARKLHALGTRIFAFHSGSNRTAAFKALAKATGGVYRAFDPHVEMVAERVPQMLAAISDYVVGGVAALEARDDESANLLLEQMTTADRTLARNV